MTTLYLDCVGGASGDMLLAALIDAGASAERVRADLSRLGLTGWRLETEPVTKGSIRALRARVDYETDLPERSYTAIVALISQSDLPDGVKRRGLATFERLARAESAIHGVPVEAVHFHEAGSLDAIVDVVGCASAMEQLGVSRVVCSPLPLGRGQIETAHGVLPLPAPAVTELVKGMPIVSGPDHETVTPTGAAIIAAAAERFGPIPPMTVDAVGWGAGLRDTHLPNVVRALIGRAAPQPPPDAVKLIETNIDDMSPELIPYAIERMLAAGAQDAWVTPILMKKGRGGFLLSALASDDAADAVVDVIYRETTTFGLRIQEIAKHELAREWREVQVEGHPVRVKIARRGASETTRAPEYDDALRVAKATGMALKDVYRTALEQAERAEID